MLRLADIVAALGGELHGDPQLQIERLSPLQDAQADSLSFAQPKFLKDLVTSGAGCVIVPPSLALQIFTVTRILYSMKFVLTFSLRYDAFSLPNVVIDG